VRIQQLPVGAAQARPQNAPPSCSRAAGSFCSGRAPPKLRLRALLAACFRFAPWDWRCLASPVFLKRRNGQPLFSNRNTGGFAVGGGVTLKVLHLRLSPEIRCTRWANSSFVGAAQNPADLLVGFTWWRASAPFAPLRNTRKTGAVASGHRKSCGVFLLSWWRASAPFALLTYCRSTVMIMILMMFVPLTQVMNHPGVALRMLRNPQQRVFLKSHLSFFPAIKTDG